jgi:hypothetical protein
MTLTEFKKYANEKAEEYGISNYHVTIMACIHGLHDREYLEYVIQTWIAKDKVFIRAGQKNPSSCLVEFEDKLKAHFKEYSKEIKDIEI